MWILSCMIWWWLSCMMILITLLKSNQILFHWSAWIVNNGHHRDQAPVIHVLFIYIYNKGLLSGLAEVAGAGTTGGWNLINENQLEDWGIEGTRSGYLTQPWYRWPIYRWFTYWKSWFTMANGRFWSWFRWRLHLPPAPRHRRRMRNFCRGCHPCCC